MKKKQIKSRFIRSSVKSKYSIPQIPKVVGLKTDYGFKSTEFVSPLFGDDVKDEAILPFTVKIIGDKDKKYDAFRVEKKLDSQTAIERYGKKYFEFTNFINKKVREENFGVRSYHEKPEEGQVENDNPLFEEDNQNELDFSEDDYEQYNNDATLDNNDEDFLEDLEEDITLYEEPRQPNNHHDYEVETHSVDEFTDNNGIQVKIKAGFDNQPRNNYQNENQSNHISENEYDSIKYYAPTTAMFHRDPRDKTIQPQWLIDQANIINETFKNHSIDGEVAASKKGPAVTRHEISLMPGVNVKRVISIRETIMMNLSANSLRIEAPVPGKPYVGIEVPNEEIETIYFGDLIDSPEFYDKKHPLKVVLGEDIDGISIYANIEDMPHALIAGATNSGKSVSLHVIIMSLILKNSPEDLKLLLIDPKVVELSAYAEIPHLISPVITDPKDATSALYWVIEEVESRYRKFKQTRSRNIREFNENRKKEQYNLDKMHYIVVVIDELADLMEVADKEVEGYIKRLSQKARAAGVHLIIAIQRPTTEIISGSIKANITARIAFKMAASVDSVTILDGQGAEQLLGRGDMLFKNQDNLIRVQGAYVSNAEIYAYTDILRAENIPNYDLHEHELKKIVSIKEEVEDEHIKAAAYFVVNEGSASVNAIQTEFSVGFQRASRIVSKLEQLGIVSGSSGTLPRKVLKTRQQLDELFYGRD